MYCALGTESVNMLEVNVFSFLVRTVLVKLEVNEVPLGQVFLPVLRYIIPPMLHTHLLHVALTVRTNGRILGTFRKAVLFGTSGALDRTAQPFLSSLNTMSYGGARARSVFRDVTGV